MLKLIKLNPYKINKVYNIESVYINPENICTIYPLDNDLTKINMDNGDEIMVYINIEKLVENIRND